MMKSGETLLLSRSDVQALLTLDECIKAVEQVFRLAGQGRTSAPGILGVHAANGGFHIKAATLELERQYFAAKINANFPENVQRYGLPLVQGLIVLADAANGKPLAVMDSIEITIQRTGAATAIAAKYLANPDSKVVTICGCGNQGRISLCALATVFPLQKVYLYDSNKLAARRLSSSVDCGPEADVQVVDAIDECVSHSDICVTCTPSRQPFLKKDLVGPGTFIAAVGADSETKQELEPALLSDNKIVVDLLDQCSTIGELHHALDRGLMKTTDVYAELAEVVAGTKPGRTSSDEIIVFDSTGMALQDVVTAAAVYEKASVASTGKSISFN